MARLRGTLESERGKIDSRLGHRHIHVEAQSYTGKVTTHLYAKDDVNWARVELDTHEGEGTKMVLYDGPVNPQLDGLKLVVSNLRPETKNTYEFGLDSHKFKIEPAPWQGGD
jgi:protocatechuate 3,4-dioxygenase beta subunit